jgi:hypothetical protein
MVGASRRGVSIGSRVPTGYRGRARWRVASGAVTRAASAGSGSVARAATLSPTLVLAVLRRPRLWVAAVRGGSRLAPTGWYRRPPFLPLPSPGYLGFRLETMYGSADRPADPADLVRWLGWCRDQMADHPPD